MHDSRQLRKRVRAAELLKSSSLPPSMAMRERVKSACSHLEDATNKDEDDEPVVTPTATTISDRVRSAMTSLMSSRGNNLAAILRCQASRYNLCCWKMNIEYPTNFYRCFWEYRRIDFKKLEYNVIAQLRIMQFKNVGCANKKKREYYRNTYVLAMQCKNGKKKYCLRI